MNIKKAIIITVISVFVLAAAVILYFWISGVIFEHSMEYAPDNFPNSTWICEDPEIVYHIPYDTLQFENIARATVNGETVYFFFGINSRYVEAIRYDMSYNGKHDHGPIEEEDHLLSGRISYSDGEFTIWIYKSTDKLFGGEYSTLVFRKSE